LGNENPETREQGAPGANWSLSDVTDFVEHCFDRDTILDVLMGYSAYWFPARLTLIVGRSWVQLFAAKGWELNEGLPREARRADVEADAPAVSDKVTTGTPEELGLGGLFDQLQVDAPLVRTIGIPIGARIAIVLVGKVHDEEVDTANLEAVAQVAGGQLEDVIRRAKLDSLPPPEERIPPFPEPKKTQATETAGKPGVVASVRHTQQLDSSPNPSGTLNAPRLAASDDSDAESAPDDRTDADADANATSFGLPFATRVAREASLAAAEEGERREAREDAAVERESEDREETLISSPFDEEKFPGDLGEDTSGVTAIPPRGVGEERSDKTQLGGITAETNIVSQQRAERDYDATASDAGDEESDGTPSGFLRSDEPTRRTQLGGVEGERRLVDEALSRDTTPRDIAESDARDTSTATSVGSEKSEGSWQEELSDSGVPKAMILKPARSKKKKKRADDEITKETERSPESGEVVGQVPGRDMKVTPRASLEQVSDAVPSIGTEAEDLEEPESDAGTEPSTSSNQTMFGGAWSGDESTRKFEIEDKVDDGWFDYFADVAEDRSAPSESGEALQFSLSEPSDEPNSLPPETLERLLDSGPEMVDMQEQFLILDSRDRERAMEAAEEVAQMGDTALEILDLMFPGRVFLDRYQYSDDLPPVTEHGPVLHALVRIGDEAVGIARRHMTDSSNETRFYAVFLLTKVNAEPALAELFPRLFDRDQQIRTIAADIVQGYTDAPDFDELIRRRLHEELLSDDVHVTVAANLLGQLRDTDAIVRLIDALEEASASGVQQAVLSALKQITLHDWSSPYEWRQWWEKGRDQTRQDWIIEALDAASDQMRELVYEEIQRIPGLDLNYHPDQPSKLRKRAQNQLRDWYATK
jgi:hypothetical protein